MSTLTNRTRFCFICLAFFFAGHARGQHSHQGPFAPNLVYEQAFGCLACPGASWADLNDASMADNQFASAPLAAYGNCFQGSCYYTRALEPETFSFSVPSNAQLTGIVAEVLRKASALNSVRDTLVQLLSNGLPIGDNRADTSYWGLNPAYIQYGDSMDLWGNALLPSDVNSNTFGLFLKPLNTDTVSLFTTASIDFVSITVYYQLPSGIFEHQSSDALPTVYIEENQQALVIKKGSARSEIVSIYNALGTKIFEQDIQSPVTTVNTTRFASGLYLVVIKSGHESYKKKVVFTQLQ